MSTLVLYDNEYTHITNNEDGSQYLVEGPKRITLSSSESCPDGKQNKITLRQNQYCSVENPFDKTKSNYHMGEVEIRQGPAVFSLYPLEVLSASVQDVIILNNSTGAVIQATQDFDDKKAGEEWIIKGPTSYIPTVNEILIKIVPAINISQGEAIYVRNTRTSELKMIKGPTSFIPSVNEEEYHKKLSNEEYTALGIPKNASSRAYNLQIQKNEIVCVVDYLKNKNRYVIGPISLLLGPHEGVKVLNLAGGLPKEENQMKSAILRCGPDYFPDQFNVRTKDNAVLKITISYKWKFILDDEKLDKMFMGDFVGYSCQSLRSRVRETSSQHNFEEFHTGAAKILRKSIFKKYSIPTVFEGKKETFEGIGRFFEEMQFFIFELDVKEIIPVDAEIASLLEESIKSNMTILCSKLSDTAQNEQEKERLLQECEIEELKHGLIKLENENLTNEILEKEKIQGDALIEKAKAEKEANEILLKSQNSLEIQTMKDKIELLKGTEGERYLEFMKISSINKNVRELNVIPSSIQKLNLK
eukprot:gene3362-5909_t